MIHFLTCLYGKLFKHVSMAPRRTNKMTTFRPEIMTTFGQNLWRKLEQSYSFSSGLACYELTWHDDVSPLSSRLSARAPSRQSARLALPRLAARLSSWWRRDDHGKINSPEVAFHDLKACLLSRLS